LRKAKRDHLERVYSDQKVLWMIRQGRLVFESQTSSRDHQARVHSDQKVLMMGKQEADPCEWRPNSRTTFSDDAQKRVGKQFLAAKIPYWVKAQ
jgi:hypothetical protein